MDEPVLIINTTGAPPVTARVLERAGLPAATVNDVATAAGELAGGGYRAAVLHTYEEHSAAACEVLRRATRVPLIVISPGAGAEACVLAIEAGADFCLRRPFGPLELIARLKALGQRPGRQPEPAAS